MNLTKWMLFRGFFGNVKGLASMPKKIQNATYVPEPGIVSRENLALDTGFMSMPAVRNSWVMVHKLKFRVYKNGLPYNNETTMLITDRAYMPSDPLGVLTEDERKQYGAEQLKKIARVEHAKERSLIGRGFAALNSTATTVVKVCGWLILAIIVFAFFHH